MSSNKGEKGGSEHGAPRMELRAVGQRVGGETQGPNSMAFGALLKALEDHVLQSLRIILASSGHAPIDRKAGDTAEWRVIALLNQKWHCTIS